MNRRFIGLLFVVIIGQASVLAEQKFREDDLRAMDAAVRLGIHEKHFPGAVFWLEHKGLTYSKALGQRAVDPKPLPMEDTTIFDVASLTKVVATTPAIMLLVERGKVDLDAPASRYVEEMSGGGKDVITLRQLLTHTSGLRAGLPRSPDWEGKDAAMKLLRAEGAAAPGTSFRYSDINFIALGEIVARVSRQPLDEFCHTEIFQPLGMHETMFRPPSSLAERIAPTTREGDHVIRGLVHDPTARRMGGVAGHAGLFTTAGDLARYCRMLLGQGPRVLRQETIQEMTKLQTSAKVGAKRALGWDIDSRYSQARGAHFPVGSFGHTGWTGTSLWIDPKSLTFVTLLTNRNHPSEDGQVTETRYRLGTLAAEAIPHSPYIKHGKAQVFNGVDVLKEREFAELRGLRVGLITNHTGRDRQGTSTIDLLSSAKDVTLAALFSPEHGIRGESESEILDDSRDAKTGLPVFSLYGKTEKPLPGQLKGLDALVFDIQDIGCRFYTYAATMALAMEAATESKLKFFVLDRINPIGGTVVDGPVLAEERTFTAFHEIPLQHGMTLGELAILVREDRKLDLNLHVVPIRGWRRHLRQDETDISWRNPSPNMKSLNAALLYPGVGLLEFMNISVGRGTESPFELVGAPYIDAAKLSGWLRGQALSGLAFESVSFQPKKSKFAGQECHGIRISIVDRERMSSIELGILLARYMRQHHAELCEPGNFAKLLADANTLKASFENAPLTDIRKLWRKNLSEFLVKRAACLLY